MIVIKQAHLVFKCNKARFASQIKKLRGVEFPLHAQSHIRRQQIAASSRGRDGTHSPPPVHSYVRFLSPAYRPVAAVVPEKAIS